MKALVRAIVTFEIDSNDAEEINFSDRFSFEDILVDESVKIKTGVLENRFYGNIDKIEDIIIDGKFIK